MSTAQHGMNKRFALLLFAGLVVVVPVSVYIGRQARDEGAVPTAGEITGEVLGTRRSPEFSTLTDSSFGPVRIGMSLTELQGAIGALGDTTKLKRSCDIVSAADPHRLPAGVSLTQVNGRVARIDVESDSIATDKGVRVGDTEEKVKKLYGSGVLIEPHKYIDGHYLEIKSGADSATAKGFVFETDGKKVTTFRAGFWDPVRWVEGCA